MDVKKILKKITGSLLQKVILSFLFQMIAFFSLANTEIEVDPGRPYLEDIFQIKVTVKYNSQNKENIPSKIEYFPPEGREVRSIQRIDDVKYQSDEDIRVETNFIINIKVTAKANKTEGKLIVFYPDETGEKTRSEEFKVKEQELRSKIFNTFRITEFLLLLLIVSILIAVLFLIIRALNKKKRAVEAEIQTVIDRSQLELNAIGRLLDNDETDQFVNQAFSFIKSRIADNDEMAQSDGYVTIDDQELIRSIQQSEKILHSARFSGKNPDKAGMEEIYNICKSIYEIEKLQKPVN